MTQDPTAIVLAGGRSTRFGGDKLDVDIGGATVLDRSIEAVATIASEVIVAGREAQDWRPVPGMAIRAVADHEPFGGPLQALSGALAAVTSEAVLVVAGDMPTLVPAVLELLVRRLRDDEAVDAAVLADPHDSPRRQPLPLAIRVAPAKAAAAAALDAGDRSLVRLLDRLSVAEVPIDRWLPIDPEARSLLDVDVPADLDRLHRGALDRRMR